MESGTLERKSVTLPFCNALITISLSLALGANDNTTPAFLPALVAP